MKKIIYLLTLLSTFTILGQKYELGEVTKEELLQTKHPLDTAAVAAVLYQRGTTSFEYTYDDGFVIVTEVETKIKIYKKEGLNWANFSLKKYDNAGTREVTSFSKCYTYNLEEDKIIKSKLKGEGEFEERLNKYYVEHKIALPNVKEGSIVEFKYRIQSPFISSFNDWEFQKKIPVDYSEYLTRIPDYLVYNTYYRGWLTPKLETDQKDRTFSGRYNELANRQGGFRSERGDFSFTCREYFKKYSLTNVSPLKDEGYVDNLDNYKATIIHELVSTKYPNQAFKNFATSWEDVAKNIFENDDFGGQLKKDDFYSGDLVSVLKGITGENEKINAIFNYVQTTMNWNGYNGFLSENGIKKSFKEKKGNVGDINLLLISMLKSEKINAHPVLVSTKSNGIALFPSRNAFNYVICAVELDNAEVVLLDAANKFSKPNVLPIKCLNWYGRLIRDNGTSTTINLIPNSKSVKNFTMMYTIEEDGNIKGKFREQNFDYFAYVFAEKKGNLDEDQRIESKEKLTDDSEIENYEFKVSDQNVVTETFEFSNRSLVEQISGKLYFNPMLFLKTEKNPFVQEQRMYPIDFTFPSQYKYNVMIKIPENYEVESYPESLNLGMEDGLGSFGFNIKVNGGTIQIMSSEDINQAIFAPQYYPMLKAFYSSLVDKHNERIVLKRKI